MPSPGCSIILRLLHYSVLINWPGGTTLKWWRRDRYYVPIDDGNRSEDSGYWRRVWKSESVRVLSNFNFFCRYVRRGQFLEMTRSQGWLSKCDDVADLSSIPHVDIYEYYWPTRLCLMLPKRCPKYSTFISPTTSYFYLSKVAFIRKTLVSLFCFILLSKPHKAAKERKEHKEYKHTRYDRHKGNIFKRKYFYILRSSDWVIWKIVRIFSTASERGLGSLQPVKHMPTELQWKPTAVRFPWMTCSPRMVGIVKTIWKRDIN